MSEGDVSLVRDEDVLRRMWQQTEDFGRKKEIRTHMYRLREERLRDLYSPEPTLDGKGCEFSSSPGHLRSFANQSFQSMKSKEVRDAGSPPKDFEYRGQDLKELSNAGWNVESENRTTDDGHTRVRSVQANIEGRYDVEGGKGQFAAIDQNKQSVTEYHDENTSLKRNESSSHAAAHEQVMRRTDDGSHFSSTTSSSTSTSKFQQSSLTKHETVPYITDNEHDISQRMSETNANVEEMRRSKITDYEQSHRKSDYDEAELVSKKVEYPDENTKVIVETRRLPDGTRVTSTRREFRGPVVNTSHSEHHSQNIRKENKSFTTSSQKRSDIRQTSRINDEFIDSQVHDIVDSQRVIDDIDFNKIYNTEQSNYTTDSKKTVDNQDIHKSHQVERHTSTTVNSKNSFDNNEVKKHIFDDNASDITYTISDNDNVRSQNENYSKIRNENYKNTVKKTTNIHASKVTDQHKITSITDNEKYIPNVPADNEFGVNKTNEIKNYKITKDTKDRSYNISPGDMETDVNKQNEIKTYKIKKDTEDKCYNITPGDMETEVNKPNENKAYKITKDTEDRRYNISPGDMETDVNNPNKIKTYKITKDTEDKKVEEIIEKKTTSDLYQTTYQTDFNQRKISTELSPTHQAWASTLRADTPPTTRPSTRASSPGSRTFKSSTSSLRSSVSPDKNIRKPGSRGTSPTKIMRASPSRTTSNKNSSTHLTHTVTKEITNKYTSPDRKHPHGSSPTRHSVSPDRKLQDEFRPNSSISPERHLNDRTITPIDNRSVITGGDKTPTRYNQSPEKLGHQQPTSKHTPTDFYSKNTVRPSSSPERKPPTGLTRKSSEKKPHPAKTSTPTQLEIKPDKKRDHEEFTKSVPSNKPTDEIFKEHSPSRSVIPDDIPGYMRPKSVRNPDGPRISPTRQNTDRKSPNRNTSDNTSESKTVIKTKEDYYKLVDQNTNTHSRTVDEIKYTKEKTPKSQDNNIFKSTSIQTHTKDSPDSSKPSSVPSTLRTTSRSPSPPKGPVTFTSTEKFDVKYSDEIDRTERVDSKVTKISNTDNTKDSTIHFQSSNENKNSVTTSKNKTSDRHTSPMKSGTYDQKQKCTEEINDSIRTVISVSRDDKNESFSLREKSPKKISEAPENSKNFPRNRDSISPAKSSLKYSHTTDFINTERRTEEINKKTKDRPRQLITPSTSPTRKPAGTDKAPSTGQSSPTTSVSGFVYFSSPTTGKNATIHDQDIYSETETSEYTTTDIKETPTKLPCKPPVPRQGSPSKDALPRKSSLKKTSDSMIPLPSPTEKPPTTFVVSPTEPDILVHSIVKKDRPEGPKSNSQIKQKPPLERRETYEERCRKILGMMDGSNDEATEIIVTHGGVQKHSPSISPSRSPGLKEDLALTDYSSKTTMKDKVNDFITHEQDEIRKTTKQKQNIKPTSSRDNSPTKLKDILVSQNEYTENSTFKTENKETYEEIVKSQNDYKELKRSSKSPESKFKQPSPTRETFDQQKHSRTPSPTKKTGYVKEKPKSYGTIVTDNFTKDNEFNSKNTSKQPSDEIHKDTVSKKPDKTICYNYPETSIVTKETEKSCEESRQIYYDISEKSSDTIHETKTLKKFNEPRSRTPSPTKTTAKVTEYDRVNENTKNKMRVVQSKHEKHIEPIKSRTPSPTKTVTKDSDNKKETELVTRRVPKYLPEKSNDRIVEDKHKERVHSRTPSPSKNITKISDYYTEQEIQYTSRRELKQSDVPEKITPTYKPQIPNLHARTPSPTNTLIKTTEEIRTDFNEENTRKSPKHPSEVPQYNYPKKKICEPVHTRTPSPSKSMPKATDEEDYSARQAQIKSKIVEKGNPKHNLNEPHHSRTPSPDKSFTITKHINETIDCQSSSIHQEMSDTIKTNTSTTIFKQKTRSRTPSPTKSTTKEIENKTYNQTSDVPSDKSSISQKFEEHKPSRATFPTKKQQETPFSAIHTQKGDIPSKLSHPKKTERPNDSPTASPNRRNIKLTEESEEFIVTERDQEILDKRSLKKLSPERYCKSPARDDTFDIECSATESLETSASDSLQKTNYKENIREENIVTSFEEKSRETYIPSKLPSRNVSPTKKTPGTHPRPEKTPESPNKSRSISPRKPVSPIARPQSPQIPKTGISKPKEPLHGVNKATTMTKVEKLSATSETKKTTNTIKQNSFTKTTNKPSETTKNNTTKKDLNIKITRTTSDIHKKPSPQKMRSKPEIQVPEITSKLSKQTPTKLKKPTLKEPQSKLIGKPKSATALNTSTDDEDVLVDVQQAKSSRENSPDRICPTPVNILDDVGTPRFPDEVNEPDDDYRKRTHHTIHETETIVDDIVEISEEDELFVKKSQHIDELNESLIGVHDGVKPKNTTMQFIETENRTHTDFIDENLKSDECLLSVSEKVNKFAKGPKATKECKSPSRRVVDEYDTDTVYQDNYTKLSVNDKANLFIQTAEKNKSPVTKPVQKAERPDLNDIDDSLKSDDCLLSVSDKVNKFVKTAEQFFTETKETEEKDKKIKEKHDIIMKSIVQKCDNDYYESDGDTTETENQEHLREKPVQQHDDELKVVKKETIPKKNEYSSPSSKPTDRTSTVKITTLRSSEAVKKAKALFENIASTTQKTKNQTTKLTDIGVSKKTPRTISTIVHHPSVEESATDGDSEVDIPQSPIQAVYPTATFIKQQYPDNNKPENKVHSSPTRSTSQNAQVPRSGTPSRHTVETTNTTKTVLSRYPAASKSETQKYSNADADKSDKPHDYVPGYLRPTKTSQIREETKTTEESHVSSRRGSGKFGIELRRTSTDRTSISSEGRHSVDHPQPCIEDIFDVDLLEQMLEKVTGYEQRRHIRAQIRVAKKQTEGNFIDTNTYTKTVKHTPLKNKSPERQAKPSPQRTLSPDHLPKSKTNKPMSPDRRQPKEASKPITNGHAREPTKTISEKPQRLQSPEKNVTKSISKTRSPVRHPSPEKKPSSINVTTPKSKTSRFNEYATAYMKKVGINESDKTKFTGKTKKIVEVEDEETSQNFNEHSTMRTESTSIIKTLSEKISSKDTIEEVNGKRTSSPEKKRSPERQPESPTERLYQRTPSPDFKRPKSDSSKKETIVKTVYNIEKKLQPKQVQEEKPSWVTNRNLKKITSESRTFSTKKIENEKPKYRAPSPSKVISKPTDVITSSYGPGPLDADGRPLFGIKALRHGATNYQVKGTVIRQEYHSKNGGEPEGTVSVTAYSTEPEDLEKLMSTQGERPSRLHGLAAITTTKKFGGTTGTTIKEAHSKEERASLEQFTHSDRKVTDVDSQVVDVTEHRPIETPRHLEAEKSTKINDRRQKGVTHRVEDVTQKMDERKQKKGQTVRQSSVKSLTEKFIKNATDSSRTERCSYPKAGLILRTTTTRESVSSDNSNHAGLARTDSERSLVSDDDETVVTTVQENDGRRVTTTTSTRHHHHHHHDHSHGHGQESFLDSNTKVTGVQDILTRMKNADIVITEGDSSEDAEARALLNKFLGASVLMAGMQAHVGVERATPSHLTLTKETVHSSGGRVSSDRSVQEIDLDQCWDERLLKTLLDECTDYEQRRLLRARIRALMAEQEACATAVTDAVSGAEETNEPADETREEEVTVTSSVRRNSSEKTVSSSTTTKTSKVIESVSRPAPAAKPVSPFAKFRQLEKQNSTNSPKM